MAEERKAKWEGKASTEVSGLKAEQVWPCLEDFSNVHKWLPNLETCYPVEGVPGQPGLVRYCATKDRWANEKLIMMNHIQRCLNYEVLDNNIGTKSYVATIKVFPIILCNSWPRRWKKIFSGLHEI
ncbi:Lachrymatory-factor synthase [Melia azedarach]|uniref:Lachrymatory-factor synthase n=1 Tax=Melia azedarach TaxID=155640 RepID=A0ACC1X9S3_MELAZ|nr:Lachrymatory-factor synthase [Melia azedarach]